MELNSGEQLDWQLISAERNENSRSYVDYEVTSTAWADDPRHKSRAIKAGSATALIRLHKESGEVEILYPFPEAANSSILMAITHKLLKHHERQEYPEKVVYACG